nr:MAG TPA: hypothetical protein [Caudoviricetes sp.]
MPNCTIHMATNLILSKESSESEIKRYFNAVPVYNAKLYDSHGNKFNLI